MIFEHEIPTGSKLYFGSSAKNKRVLETKAALFFEDKGFEEILTPTLSYSQHQSIDESKKLITLSDESNNTVALRADSTLDVVRLITKRLGRATEHEKWFYIQPVFTYPANETYQIGAEWIGHDNISDIININCELLKHMGCQALVQIANINIPLIIAKEWDIDINIFKNGEIGKLFELDLPWLTKLIEVKTGKDLENILEVLPQVLKNEARKLINISNEVKYENISVSPLYYSAMKYYDDLYYRVISGNHTIAKGGSYKSEGLNSQGFAIYTDYLIKVLEKVKGDNE